MKKLLILLACSLFFAAAAYAQPSDPQCDIWMTKAGTYALTMATDYKYLPDQTPKHRTQWEGICSTGESGTCPDTAYIKWTSMPHSCEQAKNLPWCRRDQSMVDDWKLVDYCKIEKDGTMSHLGNCLYYRRAAKTVVAHTPANDLGQIEFADFRGWSGTGCADRYTASIISAQSATDLYFSSGSFGGFSGISPTNLCYREGIGIGTYPTVGYADVVNSFAVNEAVITHKSAAGGAVTAYPGGSDVCTHLMLWCSAYQTTGQPVVGGGVATKDGYFHEAQLEIFKPLHADINGDGVCDSADYGILSNEWLGIANCGCGAYW